MAHISRLLLSLLLAVPQAKAQQSIQSVTPIDKTAAQPMTLDELKKRYPQAQIQVVTPEQMQDLKQNISSSANATPPEKPTENKPSQQIAETSSACLSRMAPDWSSASTTSNTDGGFYPGSLHFGKSDSKEFLIFVVLIGVIVVAALIAYSLSYLAIAAYCGVDTFSSWQVGVSYLALIDRSSTQVRQGLLAGVRGSAGWSLPFGSMNLAAEVGHLDMRLDVLELKHSDHIRAPYFLIGPKFFFGSERGSGIGLEILTGTSLHRDIGVMSTLRLGFELALTPDVLMGFNIGALLLDMKTYHGFLTSQDQWNYLYGLSLTHRF